MIENDDDVNAMLSLMLTSGFHHVDVLVQNQKDVVALVDENILSSNVVNENSEDDLERDVLLDFCPHEERILLSYGWDNGIREVGQLFRGGVEELRIVLEKFAIGVGFKVKFLKNDKRRLTAVCSLRDDKECPWRLHAMCQTASGFFYVKSFNNVHTCGVSQSSKSSHISARLVSKLVVDEVRGKALAKPSEIKYDLKDKYGLDASYHTTWAGVEKARNDVFGDYSLSFDQLRWYGDELMKVNPGSRFEIDYNHDSGRFNRVFVAFDACIQGFNFCRPLLFVDGTFLKGRYKGTLLSATAKDGNQGIFPLAFAVVDSETIDNWTWFMNHLSEVVCSDRIISFVSDRNAGIIHSVKTVFPKCHHSFCLQHLKYNLNSCLTKVDKLLRERMIVNFRDCAYTPSKEIFKQKIEDMKKQCGKKVKDFLNNLPDENWSNAYFQGRRYGEMWSNVAESFNSMISGARSLPITKMIDQIRIQVMEIFSGRRDAAMGWHGIICPEMNNRLLSAVKFSKPWHVKKCSDDIYEVQSYPSVRVDIARGTCSCFRWQLNGFPCAHAAAAIDRSGKDLHDFVELYFHVKFYKYSYSKSIEPVTTVEKPEVTAANAILLPPNTKIPAGRPCNKRKRNTGEVVRKIRCGRCNKLGGHNKKSCKEPL